MSDGAALVGRRRELDRLREAFGDARSGRGRVVAVSGAPGVGKTAIVRAFAADAAARGATVLWGTCFEGAAQPAYDPWTTALAPLGVGPAPSGADLSPPEARLRRWAAVHDALVGAAARSPVVVVLDDLQWASTETLDLLGWVAARLEAGAVLLVATHRQPDPALEAGTALTQVLAGLARLQGWAAVHLAGLDVGEVGAFLAGSFGDEVPGAVVRAVHDHTGGNPFYVREVAATLVDEGRLVRRDGRWSSDFSLSELGIPTTVRHAVRGRLARLAPPTQALLQAASAFSGDIGLEPVREVADLDEAAALDALDEALASGFLQRAAGGQADAPYAFAHAIVRDAVADTLNPDRATRQHRRAAMALERLRPDDHAAIAEQYWCSRALPGAGAGVVHCLAAADAASGQQASRHSVRLLRLALDLVGDDHDARDLRRGILARLATAEAEALDADAASATTALALDGASVDEAADLVVRVAEALREAARPDAWEPLVRRGLELLGDRRDARWARLVTLLDPVETVGPGPVRVGRWRCYPDEAVSVLRATGLEADEARAIDPFRPRTEQETADILRRSAAWTGARPRLRALDLAGRDLSLRHGRPAAGADCYRALLELGGRVGSMPAQAEGHGSLALCLALTGDLPAAEEHLAASVELVRDLWPGHRLHLVGMASSAAVVGYMLGEADWPVLAARLQAWLGSPAAASAPFANVGTVLCALSYAWAGDTERARGLVGDLVPALEAMQPSDHAVAGSLWFATATVCELGDRDRAEALVALVDRHRRGGGPPGPASVDHAHGRLAALLGDADGAEHDFRTARRVVEPAGSAGVTALIDFDLAVLRADPVRVAKAARTFERLGMRGWVARAAAWTPPSAAAFPRPAGLTGREVEVLGLLAAGRTSQEIAAELVVSLATVNRHIANIYVKIGARNRSEATGFAIGHHLTSS